MTEAYREESHSLGLGPGPPKHQLPQRQLQRGHPFWVEEVHIHWLWNHMQPAAHPYSNAKPMQHMGFVIVTHGSAC